MSEDEWKLRDKRFQKLLKDFPAGTNHRIYLERLYEYLKQGINIETGMAMLRAPDHFDPDFKEEDFVLVENLMRTFLSPEQ